MTLNPIAYTESVVSDFLRYQLTAYRFADARLHAQMRQLLSLDETRHTPLFKGRGVVGPPDAGHPRHPGALRGARGNSVSI